MILNWREDKSLPLANRFEDESGQTEKRKIWRIDTDTGKASAYVEDENGLVLDSNKRNIVTEDITLSGELHWKGEPPSGLPNPTPIPMIESNGDNPN